MKKNTLLYLLMGISLTGISQMRKQTPANINTAVNVNNNTQIIPAILLPGGFEKRKLRLPFTDSVKEYTVEKIGHYYIMDGDIIVDDDFSKTKSYTQNSRSYQWDNMKVPFYISPNIYINNMQDKVFDAIDEMNDKLCLTFLPKTNQDDFVNIISATEKELGKDVGGDSHIGKQGGAQNLRISNTTGDIKRVLLHEMLHAVGVYHEMSRDDRDNFIKINWDNITELARYNFDKHDGATNSKFDCCSVMLYSQGAFAIDPKKSVWDLLASDGKTIIQAPVCKNLDTAYSESDITGLDISYRNIGSTFPSKIKIQRGSGERFMVGNGEIYSDYSRRYKLTYEQDGCLRIRRKKDNAVIWATPTQGAATGICIMQADGNLVMYNVNQEAIWSTNTFNNWGSVLKLQDDGNLVIKNIKGDIIWTSNSTDYGTEKIALETGAIINGTIKWKTEVGMPSTGSASDWFTVTSVGCGAFEENNAFNAKYFSGGVGHIGRYVDYKNVGSISFSDVETNGDYKIVHFTLSNLPLQSPYTFNIGVNGSIIWSGETTKPTSPLFNNYSVGLEITKGMQFPKTTPSAIISQDVEAEVTGYWGQAEMKKINTDSKKAMPKAGDPVVKPILRSDSKIIRKQF